jgi:Sec-independent protein secretion pathway component TatC
MATTIILAIIIISLIEFVFDKNVLLILKLILYIPMIVIGFIGIVICSIVDKSKDAHFNNNNNSV